MAFGVLGILATAAALVVASIFWWPILAAFADGLWHSGWPGRSIVILLAVLIAGPLAGGAARLMATTWRAAAARWESIRFFMQRRWRITAAELVAELPQAVPLDPAELGDLAGRVQRRRFTRGQTLVRQGKTAHEFHLLRRGRCTALEADRTGCETAITHLRAGDSFGQWALEHDARQPVTVRADSRGELFALDAATFTRLLAGRLAPAAPQSLNWAGDQLRALAPFRDLDQGAATELARVGTWVDVRPGHTLLRQGTTGTTVYVLATGQLQTRTDQRAGGILRAGDHVGQPVAVDEAWHSATVRALTPARLFAVPGSTWRLLQLMPVNCTGDGPQTGTRQPTHARDQS